MYLTINGQNIEYINGDSYIDAIKRAGLEKGALGVDISGETFPLNHPAAEGENIRILTLDDEEGRLIYERTLQFVMLAAARRILPEKEMRVEHSFGEGIYAHLTEGSLTPSQVSAIRQEMRAIIDADMPINCKEYTREEALAFFQDPAQREKLDLYRYRSHSKYRFFELDGMREYFYGEMTPSAGYVKVFALAAYYPGMVFLMPKRDDPEKPGVMKDMPKLARTFAQSAVWCNILECANVADINRMVEERKIRRFIQVNEALQEKSISNIADKFMESGARVVLIAGPSSSGKTTFSNRLLIALTVLGLRPVKLSVDDYYIDRNLIPLEADGTRDLERIDILDLDLLNEHLTALIEGETIQAPTFDFVTGKSIKNTHTMRVEKGQPIIIEGIHALNDEMTYAVNRDMKFKIYVSELTTLNLDAHNRIRTTDVRLLRRIVRDNLFRGTTPEETMRGWDSVRRGEEKYIFPYQESADIMFNSSLIYEISVMKKYAYPLLKAIRPGSDCYTRAKRLRKFLDYFCTADVEDEIPVNSILREFVGGCCFYREET